jgi:hypothetical protein
MQRVKKTYPQVIKVLRPYQKRLRIYSQKSQRISWENHKKRHHEAPSKDHIPQLEKQKIMLILPE